MKAVNLSIVLAAGLVSACAGGDELDAEPSLLKGAIFTTTADGGAVDENIYDAKEDVYLDGGPQSDKPDAAGLPAGDYYFQVTDPSGKTLLSTDDISCRKIRISATGVIDNVYEGAGGCRHAQGTDQDHDGITVQLMPFEDTPNPGGEYKVWITAVADYADDKGKHGFLPRYSKTDNFKVRVTSEPECPDEDECEPPPPPPEPCCGDGHVDTGEQCDDGNTTNGDGCSATCQLEPPPPPPPCCGDGHIDAGETCDDGNTTDGDGCSATCQLEPRCGDSHVDAGEQCDDGNTTAGDGCSATCQHEPRCGDHVVDAGEECDDGNTTAGDGCSAECKVEHVCPSACP